MRFFQLTIITIALLSFKVGFGQRDYFRVDNVDDLKTIQSLSEQSQKGILLVICSSSVDECKSFSRRLANRELVQYLSIYFLLAEIEGNSRIGKYLIEKYGIEIYPSLLWFAPNEYAVQLNEGMLKEEAIRAHSLSAASRINNFEKFGKSYSLKTLTTNGKKAYLEILELNRLDSIRVEVGESLLYDVFPDFNSDSSLTGRFFEFGLDVDLPFIPYILANTTLFEEQNPNFPTNLAIQESYLQNLQSAIINLDSVKLNYIIDFICPFRVGEIELPTGATTKLLYQMENQQWDRARKSASDWLNEIDTTKSEASVFTQLNTWILNYRYDTTALSMFYDFTMKEIQTKKKDEFKKQIVLMELSLISKKYELSETHLELAEESMSGLSERAKAQALKRRLLSETRKKPSKGDAFFTD